MLEPLPSKRGPWTPDWRYEQFLRQRFLNLGTEWQKMLVWLTSNPSRQKTDMRRFVGNWMAKSGVLRPEVMSPPKPIEPEPDRAAGRVWITAIKAQMRHREPGED